jgi:hypothetical protein
MKAEFTKFHIGDNWVKVIVGNYTFSAKLFDEGSVFGINEGRVSKLMIWDEQIRYEKLDIFEAAIVNYDRGWDIKPETEEQIAIFDAVMDLLENSPKIFEE